MHTYKAPNKNEIHTAVLKAKCAFKKKFQKVWKANPTFVIFASIAVTAKEKTVDGKMLGYPIVDEMWRVSLYASKGSFANMFCLVAVKGKTYFHNPTTDEQRNIADEGELVDDAGGDKLFALSVKRALQAYVINIYSFHSLNKMKLLPLSSGNGTLRLGDPTR